MSSANRPKLLRSTVAPPPSGDRPAQCDASGDLDTAGREMARGTMSAIRTADGWRVALLYVALTLLLAYPLTTDPAGRLLSTGPDPNLFMWILAWDTHALTHNPLAIFDANIYYPELHALAYSENLIGSAPFAAPVLWLTGNAVLAMNVVSLLSSVLCGLGAFFLARRIGVSTPAGVLSGLVFAFSPPHFLRFDQLHLTTIQWMPFSLAFLHTYLKVGRPRDLRAAAAFFTLQALTSGHGAAFLLIGILVLIGCRLALGEPPAVMRRIRDLGIRGTLLLAPTLLILVPYRSVQTAMHLTRGVADWTTEPSSFLASPTHVHAFALSALGLARINDTANAYLFPGYLPLLLAAAAFLQRRASRSPEPPAPRSCFSPAGLSLEVAAAMSLALATWSSILGPVRPRLGDTVLFSLRRPWRMWIAFVLIAVARLAIARRSPLDAGPRLRRMSDAVRRWAAINRRNDALAYVAITLVSVWLAAGQPARLWTLVYWLPGLNFIRVPSRFMLLAILGLAILAGFGFDRVAHSIRPGHEDTKARKRILLRVFVPSWLHSDQRLAAVIGVLLVAEFAAFPLGLDPYRVEIPAIDRWLAAQPKPFVVAEVPLPSPNDLGAWERRQTSFMLHSMAHWQKTVHGYSGLRLPLHVELYEQLTRFPDEQSLASLNRLGVTYVVVHADWYRSGDRAEIDGRLNQFSDRLRLTHTEGAGGESRVYAVVSASARTESR